MRRRDEVLVGILTTVAVIIAALSSIWLVRGALSKGYPLHAEFRWGAGVKQGRQVWLVGVTVGFVDKVELDPRGTLLVTMRIRDEYQVPRGSRATIVPNGFFGDVAVALTPEAPNLESYAPGDTVPAGPTYGGLATLTSRADTLVNVLGSILGGVETQLIDSGGLAQLRQTTLTANRLFAQLSVAVSEQSRELGATMAVLRSRLEAVSPARIDSTFDALQGTAAQLELLAADLRATTSRFNALVARVDSADGSLGRLVNDPALYNDTRQLLVRLDSLIIEFRANPRKFIRFSIW